MKNTSIDTDNISPPPDPKVKKKFDISMVWLIPLMTALIGGWLIYKTISEKGPQIEISFKTAEGIEAGKTKIKYKEIDIGVVDSVQFSQDFSHVILTANMDKGAESFLHRDTHFWVVKPRLSLRGASGLSTLLSGVYIEIEPGPGMPQKRFTGLDKPPVVKVDMEGSKVMMLADNLGSLDAGSPVYYQGILAGEVLGWELGNDQKSIFIHAFIKAPYHKIVKSNTRFWNISGIDLSVGAEGISMRTESIQSLLYGGVAFETPDTLGEANENIKGLIYTLHDNYKSIEEQSFTKKVTFILFFEGSVRGLNIGAPVEFNGIKIGSVKDVRLEFIGKNTSFRIPVLVEIEPERIISRDKDEVHSPINTLNLLVKKGLRAKLQTGSLLTGQLIVDLEMHPDTPIKLVNSDSPFPELPTIPAELEQITTSVKNILAEMEKLNLEKIAQELLETLEGTNKLAKGANTLIGKKELRESVDDVKNSLQILKSILHKVDQRIDPITVNLERAMGAGNDALEKAQNTLDLVDNVLSPDSPLHFRFIELSGELVELARSIRSLIDMLERHPNSIIFGKEPTGEE